MTAATKAATTTVARTREEDLEEQVAHHRAELAKIEGEAVELDASAATCEQNLERLLQDFSRPAEGIPQDRRALEASRDEYRGAADFLRRRAQAYSVQYGVKQLEAELANLQNSRREAEARAAAHERYQADLEEYLARVDQVKELRIAAELAFGRARSLVVVIQAAARQWGFDPPGNFDGRLGQIQGEVNNRLDGYPRASNGYTTWPIVDSESLPSLSTRKSRRS